MFKSEPPKSPRKLPSKGLGSPRLDSNIRPTSSANNAKVKTPTSIPTTPRSPRKILEPKQVSSQQTMKKESKVIKSDKVEIMELPARLVPGSNNSVHLLSTTTSADRIRNGGSGDSCMRLPLECLSKADIKSEMRMATLRFPHLGFQDEEDEDWPNEKAEEAEQEEVVYDGDKMTTILAPDRARFNIWQGTNYDLHLLGDFKTDFDRRVKSFQRPETEKISLDPFCREESGLKEEPHQGEAFLVWKNDRNVDQWQQHSNPSSDHDITTATLIGFDEDDDVDEDDVAEDGESDADTEITGYIRGLKQARKEGRNCTGETLYYDEEFGVVRNLHKDSHSLTNYGVAPDDTWIGKAAVFYPEMTAEEKRMLKAIMSETDKSGKAEKTSAPAVAAAATITV